MGTEQKNMLAWYKFNNPVAAGEDASGNGKDALPCGAQKPYIGEFCGRTAAVFAGGESKTSYFQLPDNVLEGANDDTGVTVSAWICGAKASSVWERIFDFGKGQSGPYLFFTRFFRAVCFENRDLFADVGKGAPDKEWVHVAVSVAGTKGGTQSNAGPRVYINGELAADGLISQTSSGNYKELRAWFEGFGKKGTYVKNYIGSSQYDADPDFHGAISDFRIYKEALTEEQVLGMMCEVLETSQILALAKDKFLQEPGRIVTGDLALAQSLMDGLVKVNWSCDHPELISKSGEVTLPKEATGVRLTATMQLGEETVAKEFSLTVVPQNVAPYEFTIHGKEELVEISPTLYGLFFEDINHAADGGIYAQMVQNPSFEEFYFDTYDARSGENAISTGRIYNPLRYWLGDLDRVSVGDKDGICDTNPHYLTLADGVKLYNHGYCDNTMVCAMNLKAGAGYELSFWARGREAALLATLLDADGNPVSETVRVEVDSTCWERQKTTVLTANKTTMGQLCLEAEGTFDLDMVHLMPQQVWGATEEELSPSAHANFSGNPNYRLRRDLVEVLLAMKPTFLRFPGGCISEGSYIWENVYDWKDSVGPVERRLENFNVWGYTMTMGLGYMEYFQLAEDLNAKPLPVMACGVLCQARSDYANPAGGKLREKYIKNFTDLIDFAISVDFENNEWAALRRDMGHAQPFDLHHLGVGNENWGTEFFANFEVFKQAIKEHMDANYPGYELHIISTAGAQADDDAYRKGWKFLAGYQKGKEMISFTDGKTSWTEAVEWYPYEPNHMDTIVDEHYYRSNDYLLENVDRYNYYVRGEEHVTSKVFVGEYASSDKNTLAGAIAEAAVMTGFEKNSDVVRLAATAPLFNKVGADGTYRWTPDAIWFDDETVWRTPNYYVQQLFASYLGTRALKTTYHTYVDGAKTKMIPHGGIFATAEGDVEWMSLTVTANATNEILFEQDFDQELSPQLVPMENGYYLLADWSDYTVTFKAYKKTTEASLSVGAGLLDIEKMTAHEYCVGTESGTGLKVYKDGKEAYTMGDYSSSVFAGNLRSCFEEEVDPGVYEVTVCFGKEDINCFYKEWEGEAEAVISGKLESYNRDVYHSVTEDEGALYIKLVNADTVSKDVKITLEDIAVEAEAERVTLTADKKWLHTPNVNTKECEVVKPQYDTVKVAEQFELTLPENAVVIIKLKKR